MMKPLAIASTLSALTLVSCSSITGTQVQAEQPQPLRPYGSEGTITRSELATLKGLAWPQQYEDMVGTFGFPYYRSATTDYYQVTGTTDWVAIYYSDRTATAYDFANPPLPTGEP